jgi:hypothetical protein
MTDAESPVTGRSVFAPALDSRAPVRVLAVHTSPPLLEILEIINKRSHNLMAEQVLRTVGRVATGEGSVRGGERAVRHMLGEGGRRRARSRIYDGSGLSVLNRSSARDLISCWRHGALADVGVLLADAAGGGCAGRAAAHAADAAAGNLRAKTGTIDNVSALSGYVRAANGERLAFASSATTCHRRGMAKRVEDAIGARLAAFDRNAAPPMPDRRGVARARRRDRRRARSRPQPAGRTPSAAATRWTPSRGSTARRCARCSGPNPGLNARRLIPGRTVRILPDSPNDGAVSRGACGGRDEHLRSRCSMAAAPSRSLMATPPLPVRSG